MGDLYPRWLGLLLLSGLLLATAIYGWRSSPQGLANRRFAMQTLVVTWWVIGIAGTHGSHTSEFWGRWTFAAAALMPLAFLLFVQAFPIPNYPIPPLVLRSVAVFAFAFAAAATATPWIAYDFVVRQGILTRTPGPLMRGFSLFFVASTVVIFVLLVRKWRLARGVARAQLRLYSVGLLLFCIGGITTNLLLPPLVGDSRYSTLGPCFVLVFLAFVAHGVIRHRLMNLRLVVHRWLSSGIASLLSVMPLMVALLSLDPSGLGGGAIRYAVAVLVAGLAAPPIWTTTRYVLHRYVCRGDADFRTLISAASDRLSRVLSPQETAVVVIDTIVAAVRPDGVAVYITGDSTHEPTLIASHQVSETFIAPQILPKALTANGRDLRIVTSSSAVVAEAGRRAYGPGSAALDMNQWALLIPFVTDAQSLGAVAIGVKLSGDPYYVEDVGLLQVLASQATIAFKNGQLYERVLLANQHIENIVATVQSGIVVVDGYDRVRLMNDAAVRLLGIPDVIACPFTLTLSDIPEPLRGALKQSLESDSSERVIESAIPQPDRDIPIVCSMAPLRNSHEELVGIVAALSDLSTVKALEVERDRAERLNYFETLAATLAHEIANPIAPIKTMTQLLPDRYRNVDFINHFTVTVTREISRIEKLVDRLRSLSKPAHQGRACIDLRTLLRESVNVMRPLFEEKCVPLTVEVSQAPLFVSGDGNELHELFLNLLTNALEATSTQSPVCVEALRDLRECRVSIADGGPGISPDVAERIFEPFVSCKARGSGLGLTVCRGIVTRHGGRISASNTDRGALFEVYLPLLAAEHNATAI